MGKITLHVPKIVTTA